LKQPVWKPEVALYFFFGGLAGASAVLAFGARLAGNRALARAASLSSLAAVSVCPPLLIRDLGRPARFLNMFRVIKPTSPMSLGSWMLAAFAGSSAAAARTTLRLPVWRARRKRL
jgi:formate-dependent nitrite reductase membrane component NrfD